MLTRLSTLSTGHLYRSFICDCTRAYTQTPRKLYPIMAAISDSEILSRFSKLSIHHPEVIQHAPVKSGAEWRAELDRVGKSEVVLTKTVSPSSFQHLALAS